MQHASTAAISHELATVSMWRNQQACRVAIIRRDWPRAQQCLDTITQIETTARLASLRKACASARKSLARAVSRHTSTPIQPEPESAA